MCDRQLTHVQGQADYNASPHGKEDPTMSGVLCPTTLNFACQIEHQRTCLNSDCLVRYELSLGLFIPQPIFGVCAPLTMPVPLARCTVVQVCASDASSRAHSYPNAPVAAAAAAAGLFVCSSSCRDLVSFAGRTIPASHRTIPRFFSGFAAAGWGFW